MAHRLLTALRQTMNVIPTAVVVAAETAFAAAIPLPEPMTGVDPAVDPPAGKTPAAAAQFILCLTTALAAPPAANAAVEQNQAAVPAVPTTPSEAMPLPPLPQSPVTGDAATTPVQANSQAMPQLLINAEQPTETTVPAAANQVVAPPLAVAPEQVSLATIPPKAAPKAEPVQRRAASQTVPPTNQPTSASAPPVVPAPAAVVPDTSPAQQRPADHRGAATGPPAPLAAAPDPAVPGPADAKPSPDGAATPDKPPVQPPQSTLPNRDAEADVAAPIQQAPPPPASPLPAAVAVPDITAPSRLEPASAALAVPAHAAASPAAQLAPAIVALNARPDGSTTLTMRLQPPELGEVHIAIERPQDAPPRVDITVERAETLTLLLRDQPQLQRVLDQAGVPSEGRSVAFHLATPEPSARPETPVFATPTGAAAYAGDDRRGPPREPVQQQPQPQSQSQSDAAADQPDSVQPLPVWLRAGLDITA